MLGKDIVNDLTWLYASQLCVDPLKALSQPLVIYTQQMQDRGVKIVHRHGVLDRSISQIIGGSVSQSRSYSSSCQPDTESFVMMIPAVSIL